MEQQTYTSTIVAMQSALILLVIWIHMVSMNGHGRKIVQNCQLPDLSTLQNVSILVTRSEAKDLLGDDWVQRHRRIVQQHANHYKRISWSKLK
ncbi:hypothetical protein RND81_03G055100 [Saponaria officinalis]|uniref:Exocyst complex subunit Exo70 C-terminal domain-containing protein n=1 Tax=Saponaria officinalis TaxID=3572 RepID=A0AAW1M1G2_SAPOF